METTVNSAEHFSRPVEEQVRFFLPLLEDYIKKVEEILEKKKEKTYSETEWLHIIHPHKSGQFLNSHLLQEGWKEFEQFLRRQNKLFLFIEDLKSGLIDRKSRFWTFFSASTADDYFKNQLEKPKGFHPDQVITMPHIKLAEPLLDRINRSMGDPGKTISESTDSLFEIIEYTQWYLQEEEKVDLESQIKKSVIQPFIREAESLLKDIHDKPETNRDKRLSSIFRIGWRYFRENNELENRYFKKLISTESAEQEKGLKLSRKKAMDYLASIQNS